MGGKISASSNEQRHKNGLMWLQFKKVKNYHEYELYK